MSQRTLWGRPCAACLHAPSRFRPSLLALVGALAAGAAILAQPGGSPPVSPGVHPHPNFDIRTLKAEDRLDDQSAAYLLRTATEPAVSARASGLAKLRNDYPALEMVESPSLGVPEVIGTAPQSGFLTGPSDDRPATLRAFLAAYASAYGLAPAAMPDLRLIADYVNPSGTMAWVEFEQRLNDLPIFQGNIRGAFTSRGELVRTTGLLVGGVTAAALPTIPSVAAATAVSRAAETVGWSVDPIALAPKTSEANGTRVTFAPGAMAADARVWLLYFPVAPGVVRLAWATEIWGDPDVYLIVIDADDGTPLFRKNLTSYQSQPATYSVYPSDSPAPASPTPALPGASYQAPFVGRQLVTLIGNEAPNTFNNLGWMTDNTNGANGATSGNNVIAGLDRVAPDGIDGVVGGTSRVFNFAFDPEADDPLVAAYQQGEVTNYFYWVNRFHDATYRLGFVEPSFNFQNDNFGRGGAGNDRINAEAQNFPGVANATFSAGADGSFARLQMFIWTEPTPDRGGGLDQDVVLHELTHGLSSRLHGNGTGLGSNMAVGLGEGWSDFVARALLATADEDASGLFTIGPWVTRQAFNPANYYYGIRRFPYAPLSRLGPNGRPHSPLTFADVDSTQDDLTDGAFPPGPLGSATPDQVHNIGEIWAAMLMEIRARFIGRLGFAGNERFLQFVVDGMKIDPVNPTFLSARDAILAAADAGEGTDEDLADIWAGFAARGLGVAAAITVVGTGVGDTRVTQSYLRPGDPTPAVSINDVAMAEGHAGAATFTFTATLVNQAGAASVSFATADGSATAGSHTTTTDTNLLIPGAGTGAIGGAPASTYPVNITIAGAPSAILAMSVSLLNLSHTFPGDLEIMLRGPGGQTVMLLSDVGQDTDLVGANLQFRDDGAVPGTPLASGTYRPTDLVPGESLPAPAPAAPYSTALSVFNGTDPNGTWTLWVADDFSGDTGSLGTVVLSLSTGDYAPASGVLSFPNGTTSLPVEVTVYGNTTPEPHETFQVVLSNPFNAVIGDGIGQGTIINDDGGGPAPTAVADAFVVATNGTLAVAAPGVLANDAANGGGSLTPLLVSGVTHGALALALDSSGGFTYVPAAGYAGPDSFTYRALNTFGQSSAVAVSISVAPPPNAAADAFATSFQVPLTIAAPGVLANDSSNGGGALTAQLAAATSHGSLTLNGDGSFTYTPAPGYSGADGFSYRAASATGLSAAVAVAIAVGPPPAAVDDSYVTAFNTALAVPAPGVLGNDSSNGGGALAAVLVSSPARGALSLAADGSFTYTPTIGFAGSDSFTYRAQAAGPGNAATVTLTVNEPTTIQPPTDLYVSALAGNTITFRFAAPALGPDATGFVLEGGINPNEVLASIATGSEAPIFTIVAPTGSFYVRMHALAGAEKSAASNEIRIHVNVPAPPAPPADLTAMVNDDQVVLAWRNTFAGGPPAAIVLDVSGDATAQLPLGPGESLAAAGVPPGTYTLSVRAVNAGGASPASAPVTITIPGPCSGAPLAPPNFLAYRVGNVAHVVWEPPATGPAPSSYVLEVSGSFVGSFATTVRALSSPVGPGSYTLSVGSVNACGSSAPTAPQTVVVP